MIDSAIYNVRKTLTHIVENSAIDEHDPDLVEMPTQDLVLLVAVCIEFLKGSQDSVLIVPLWNSYTSYNLRLYFKFVFRAYVDYGKQSKNGLRVSR